MPRMNLHPLLYTEPEAAERHTDMFVLIFHEDFWEVPSPLVPHMGPYFRKWSCQWGAPNTILIRIVGWIKHVRYFK